MDGYFNPDLQKQPFAEMDTSKDIRSSLTNARIKFQRLCTFRQDLSVLEKAELAGLTVDEVWDWWYVAFAGKA